MAIDRRQEHGPFDIIGDVHGCYDELCELLALLGYKVTAGDREVTAGERHEAAPVLEVSAPDDRRVIFVGDLVDRGPRTPDVLRLVMHMVGAGQAFCVPGNHDDKFRRWLQGRKVKLTHGLETSARQMEHETAAFKRAVAEFIDSRDTHLWLDDGKLVVAHAGILEEYIGTSSGKERHFCLYGDTTGERDEHGLPIRYNWAAEYHGDAAIIYGHTPIPEPRWLNNTLCIDTGCVFGGRLTALRWPERELLSVEAKDTYARRIRPFSHPPNRPGVEG